MEEKYLELLKQKIGSLGLEESILRDLYLSKLASGEVQGPPVGYSSIDKTWLRNYDDKRIMEIAPELTIYENLYENNKDYLDDVAFRYYGTKITYGELFEKIENTAKSFINAGVKKGDIVTICSITTPEVIYSFYALNKIGAISNMIDIRYTKQAILEYINEVKSKMLITLDLAYPKIKDIVDDSCLEKVVTISPINSVPPIIRTIARLSDYFKGKKVNIPDNSKYYDWNKIYSDNLNIDYEPYSYHRDDVCSIVHTGGTTGPSKGVLLTNDNFNYVTLQTRNVVDKRGYNYLNIMPPLFTTVKK